MCDLPAPCGLDGPEDETTTALAADLLRAARTLVSQMMDDVLPVLRRAASGAERAALSDAEEHVARVWAHLTFALASIGADL